MHRLVLLSLVGAWFVGQAAAQDRFLIDPESSAVTFKIRKHGVTWVDGSFKKLEGLGFFDPSNPANSRIEVQVEAASVDTANDKRDNALRGSDYFNVAAHPHLTFKSLSASAGENGSLLVEGEFTMLGVTKTLTIPVTIQPPVMEGDREVRMGEASFTIRRSDFGMTTNPMMIGDDVHISLKLKAIRQSDPS